MSMPENFHMGRSWSGHWIEDECPCPQEPCGLVSYDKVVESCPQHYYGRAKTMRSIHLSGDCERIVAEQTAAKAKGEAAEGGIPKVIFSHK